MHIPFCCDREREEEKEEREEGCIQEQQKCWVERRSWSEKCAKEGLLVWRSCGRLSSSF